MEAQHDADGEPGGEESAAVAEAALARHPRLSDPQAFAFPGTVYSIALFINLFLSIKRSSLAVPLTTLITLFMLWFGVSVPLTFVGSYLGFKREEIKHPVRVNNIPRQIPAQPWYLHPVPSILVGGILPFGAVFIELYFVMSAIWLAQVRGRA